MRVDQGLAPLAVRRSVDEYLSESAESVGASVLRRANLRNSRAHAKTTRDPSARSLDTKCCRGDLRRVGECERRGMGPSRIIERQLWNLTLASRRCSHELDRTRGALHEYMGGFPLSQERSARTVDMGPHLSR